MASVTLRASFSSTQRSLTRGAHNAQHSWFTRDAHLITLESDSGLSGRGECAPLPDFSPDRLEDDIAALRSLDLASVPERLDSRQNAVSELSKLSARLPRALPAARAALEGALLDLWSRAAGCPAWALLAKGSAVPTPRRVAALLMGEPEAALEQAERARSRGIRCFKFKIGRPGAIERELSAVAGLRRALGPAAGLRLDANGGMSVREARACLPRFTAFGLEYIEEPCAPEDLPQLADLALPIAWDESLASHALPVSPLRALVLKPTLLGGISACANWAERAAAIGAEVILSHAFEGPLGLALSATLALTWGSKQLAHGLDVSGARLAPEAVPYLAGAELVPWGEPGFGLVGVG